MKKRKSVVSESPSQNEQDQIESYKRKQIPRGKRTQKPSKPTKPRRSAPTTDDTDQVIEIKNQSGSFKHTRPSFIKRWDGVSNQLHISQQEYRELPPGLTIYWKYKSQHMNVMVFVQMGRIEFHAYENDAIRLNELFGKNIGRFSKCLMVHFWEKELELLKVELFKMKIPMHFMNEIQDDEYRALNKLIRREVTEVINPAVNITYRGEKLSNSERYLMSIYKEGSRYGIAVVNCQTNRYYVQDVNQSELRRVLNKFKPVQVIFPRDTLKLQRKMVKQISNPYICQLDYKQDSCMNILDKFLAFNDCQVFETMSKILDTLPQGEKFQFALIVYAIDVTLEYFKKLGLERNIFSNSVFNLVSFAALNTRPVLDSQVYENLEIFEVKDKQDSFGSKGTLFAYLNKCKTASGARKLRKWLDSPLTNPQQIKQRQQAITDIIYNSKGLSHVFSKLSSFPDFQTKIANVYHWVVDRSWKINFKQIKDYDQSKNPAIVKIRQIRELLREIIKFQEYIEQFEPYQRDMKSKYLIDLTTVVSEEESERKAKKHSFFGVQVEQLKSMPHVRTYCEEILGSIVYNERTNTIQPVPGTYQDFDNRKDKVNFLYKKLDEQLEMWKQKLNCKKLKYVSARNRNQIQMPKGTIKQKMKQLHFSSSTVKADRFTTLMTQQLTAQVQQQQQQMDKSIGPFLESVIQHFSCFKTYWMQVVHIFSQLDVLHSLAQVSKEMEISCIPQFAQDEFQYEDGIHVGLAQMTEGVVRNSVRFSGVENVLLITGPNMGGKSTILRQTCLLAIIAQIGCYVPARRYRSVPFDHIFCRIGASDRIIENKSTFYIELQETKNILDYASRNSLVIIDQLGRGTSTFDGISIAYGTLSNLIEQIGCFTLFSTHYSILADEFALCKNVRNKTLEYHLSGIHLNFTYKLIDGVAEKSFAENVARMVGINQLILKNARERSGMITKETRALRDLQQLTKKINDIFISLKVSK